jgi:hypothetical protein
VNFWKIIMATVVIFAAGVTTGGLLVNCIDHTHRNNSRHAQPLPETRPQNGERGTPARTMEFPKPRQPDLLSTNFIKHLDDALKLTLEQQNSIQTIIAEGQERNHAIWTNNAEQMREVVQDVRHRVRELLTADQQKQFEELMKHVPRRPANNTNAPPVLSPTNAPAAAPANAPGV